jgi:hypothetical protein
MVFYLLKPAKMALRSRLIIHFSMFVSSAMSRDFGWAANMGGTAGDQGNSFQGEQF